MAGDLTLSYLYAFADNDISFVKEILELMEKNIPIDLESIAKAIDSNNLTEVKRSAHHMKSSVQYSDYLELSDFLSEIETKQDSPTAIAEIKGMLPHLKQLLDNLLQVMETEMKKIG
jgi:HPt (histidine-containing phosphotransfer) domain-containing protein